MMNESAKKNVMEFLKKRGSVNLDDPSFSKILDKFDKSVLKMSAAVDADDPISDLLAISFLMWEYLNSLYEIGAVEKETCDHFAFGSIFWLESFVYLELQKLEEAKNNDPQRAN